MTAAARSTAAGESRDQLPVLVTGCAGMIGSRVAAMLMESGRLVVGVDDLNPSSDPLLRRWRLARLQDSSRFEFELLDVSDRAAVTEMFRSRSSDGSPPFSAVLNLAARAGVRQSLTDPVAYFRTNLEGTLALLDECKEHGVGKFVLASTSSVYGASAGSRESDFVAVSEDMATSRMLSPYAASKWAAEALCHSYHHLYGTDVTVLRYFTVYGPAGRPDMSMFRFIKWITEGQPLTVFGDGTQRRDFTFVDDIARGTLAAMRPLGFEVINLGSDQPVTVRRVIELIEAESGAKAKIEYRPRHPADVFASWANINRARTMLDWSPSVSLKEGVVRMFAWYRENRDWAREISTD